MTISRIPSVEGGIQPTLLTAKGDLISATAASTVARLAVGSDAQILVADSSTATGLKWATPATASSGLTLISRQSFSNVATTGTTFDSIFSSTYKTYQVVIENMNAATSADDAQFQLLYSGTTQAATYTGVVLEISTGSVIQYDVSTSTQFTIASDTGDSTYKLKSTIFFNDIGGSSMRPAWYLTGFNNAAARPIVGGAYNDTARTYTGLLFKSSSSNITGTVSVYGLAAA